MQVRLICLLERFSGEMQLQAILKNEGKREALPNQFVGQAFLLPVAVQTALKVSRRDALRAHSPILTAEYAFALTHRGWYSCRSVTGE